MAWQASIPMKQLVKYNDLSPPYTIKVGQTLRLTQPPKTSTINKSQKSKKNVKIIKSKG